MIYRTVLLLIIFISCHTVNAQISQSNSTVQGNNQFAIDLYKKLSNDSQKNIFMSPYSISSALAMTYAGAQGITAQEMTKVLHFSKKAMNSDFQNLSNHFNNVSRKGLQLSIVNVLWCEKSIKFLNAYLGLTQNYYQTKVENLDFKKQYKKSRLIINQWVAGKTKNKVQNLILKGLINPDTRLVLTNAIYFNGHWRYKFKKNKTRKIDFTTSPQKSTKIDFMTMQRHFKYTENKNLQVIEIPYTDNKMSMVVMLPKDKNGLNKLNNLLTLDGYQKLIRQLRHTNIQLSLPRFKMTQDIKLKRVFKQMGMRQAFTKQADFSGMTGNKSLKIGNILHKAFVEVSEKGTEAAAATSVIMMVKESISASVKVFKADHPFMFIIKDNTTESILFIGRFMKSAQAS